MDLAYYRFTMNMDTTEKAKFDQALAPPEERDVLIGRQNAEAMKALAGFGLPPMPPARGMSG